MTAALNTPLPLPVVIFISLLFMLIVYLLYRQRQHYMLVQQHQRLETELRAHRDQFRTLVNNIPGITYRCLYDDNWTMLFISTHVDHISGYSAEELLNNKQISYAKLILPEDDKRVSIAVQNAIKQGQSWEVEYRVRHKNGTLRWAFEKGQAVYDEQGKVKFLDGFILDMTDEKTAKASLQRFATLVRHSNDSMFVVRQGIIIDCNNAAVQMFQKPYEEIVGFSPAQISPPLQDNGETSAALAEQYIIKAANGPPQRFEWWHLRADGSVFDAEVALSSFEQDGEVLAIGIVRDITDIKRREREIMELNTSLEQRVKERTTELSTTLESLKRTQYELLQSEKLASLGALVAGVAHELNTPIGNAVTVSSSLVDEHRKFEQLLAQGLTRSALQAFLHDVEQGSRIIERNLVRAAELIGGFKQLAVDQTSYQRRHFMLDEIVHEVTLTISPTLRRAAVVLHQSIPVELALDSFPGPLGQVLLNLINNAVVHAYEKQSDKQLWITGASDNGWITLNVRDNGAGIAKEHLKRIFDPFYTTRLGQGGSGLGLHITSTLVTGILGGRIEVANSESGGASFTLHLPLTAPMTSQVTQQHDA